MSCDLTEYAMQQWEKDLRDLIRRPPTKDVKGTIQRIMRGRLDDRSTALTCGALAEVGLVAGIANLLQPKQIEIIDLFWTPGGKYGSFDKKIKGAVKLGLLGPMSRENIDIIRQVRNVFAHSISEVQFTTPAVNAACALIVLPTNLPKERARSRKSRFAYCQICDQVFRIFLGYAALSLIAPQGKRISPQKPLLP
jgi:hypothetical protein